jgi:ATP-binding cassette subfamily B protein
MIEHDDQIAGRIFDKRILARILPFAMPHIRLFIGATVLLFLTFGLEVGVPFVWRWMVDVLGARRPDAGFVLDGALRVVAIPLALLAVAYVALGFLRYAQGQLLGRGGQEVIYDIRKALFGHLQRQPLAFYDRHAVGRLVTRVTSDVENVSELFTSGLATVVYDVLKVFGVAILLLALDWRMGAVAVGLAPLLALVSLWFRRRARDCFREVRTWLGRSNGYLQEAIAGIRVIQVFGKEEKVARKFETITAGYLAANVKTVFYFALFFPLVESAIALDQGGVLLVGGGGVEGGRIEIGMFLQFWLYLELLFTPLRELGEKYNVLQSAMASAERIFRLLDETPTIETPTNAVSPADVRGRIELADVSFSYDAKIPVLKNVSLRVEPGETLALVGATGSGKTTIASLLSRFYDVRAGSVRIDGIDVRQWDLARLRTSIGFVPQDLFLFAGTIHDNIALWRPGISRDRVKEALRAVGAQGFVARLAPAGAADALDAGLDAPVAERGVTFSVGERQLLAFARALAGDPAMVILDEATANVDTETELRVQAGIAALLRGRTSVVIAHRLSTVREANKIAVLHKGELRELGTHEELLRKGGIYAKLVRLQFGNTGERSPAAAAADDAPALPPDAEPDVDGPSTLAAPA